MHENKAVELTPSEKEWEHYYEAKRNQREVEPIYSAAIHQLSQEHPAKELHALELGAGVGTVTMLIAMESARRVKAGNPPIEVIAEDQNLNGLEIIQQNAERDGLTPHIKTRQRDMTKDMGIPGELFDLIVARAVFPWLVDVNVSIAIMVLENITKKLVPGGYVVAEFFGNKHPWGTDERQCRTHTKEEVEAFFKDDYEKVEIIEYLTGEMLLAEGGTAGWHEFTVFAKRKPRDDNLQEGAAVAEKEQSPALGC